MLAKAYFGAEHYTRRELLRLGRLLTEHQLRKSELYEPVLAMEREHSWRLRAAVDLLRLDSVSSELLKALQSEAADAERQVLSPSRGRAKLLGDPPLAHHRKLPRPGTLFIKPHEYQSWNAPQVVQENGIILRDRFRTFRFVVIHECGELLWLEDPSEFIYRNPSLAARTATGNEAENGWRFFRYD